MVHLRQRIPVRSRRLLFASMPSPMPECEAGCEPRRESEPPRESEHRGGEPSREQAQSARGLQLQQPDDSGQRRLQATPDGDLTGDGVEDILVASLESGDFRVLVGDGQGGFPLLPTFPGTLGASDAVLQDMTGDGLPDLVVSSLVTDRVSLVRNASEAAPNL